MGDLKKKGAHIKLICNIQVNSISRSLYVAGITCCTHKLWILKFLNQYTSLKFQNDIIVTQHHHTTKITDSNVNVEEI